MRFCLPARWVVFLALLLGAGEILGQGTFQNLGFEQALVPDVPAREFGGDVLVSNGAPHWAVYIGGNQQSSMFHNTVSLGGAAVSIFGPQWFPSQIFQGSYTVFGGDISSFANQAGELLFQGGGLLDAVQFSNVPIPEPSVFGLSSLGGLLLGWRGLGRRR